MENTRRCPYCGEEIMADAKKCKYCGEWLEAEPIQEQVPKADKQETPHHKGNKWLLAIIPIIVLIVGAILYLFGVLGNDPIIKRSQSNNDSLLLGSNQYEDEIRTGIAQQVTEAYDLGTVYDILTPEFAEAIDIAYGMRLYHVTNSYADIVTLLLEQDGKKVNEVNLVSMDKAEVHMSDGDETPVFIMVRNVQPFNEDSIRWLIDDVFSYYGLSSVKNDILNFANNSDWDQAMADWEEAMEEYPNTLDAEREPLIHHFIGIVADADVHVILSLLSCGEIPACPRISAILSSKSFSASSLPASVF